MTASSRPSAGTRGPLFAPGGTIDAGDAGVRANDLVIGALEIRGADNIEVSGISIGLPTTTSDVGALASASNTAAANQAKSPPTTIPLRRTR